MRKGFATILVLALLAAVTVLGVTLYSKQRQKPITQTSTYIPKPSINPSPNPTANSESTSSANSANWKTYTSNTFGFEVKYPPGYIVEINDPNGKKNPSFTPKNYKGYAAPGLYLDWDPNFDTQGWYSNNQRFDTNQKEFGGALRIRWTHNGKNFYAGCQLTGYNEIDVCNAMLATLKFTN